LSKGNLINTLKDIVDKAKNVIDSVEEDSPRDHLTRLYPSIGGGSSSRSGHSSVESSTTRQTPTGRNPAIRGSPATRGSPAARGYTSSTKYTPSSGKYKKGTKIKITECLKDVFFLLCGTEHVPRKMRREKYYSNGLVATAVRFDSLMDEVQIRESIRHSLSIIFYKYPITEFSFVKAVGDLIICPEPY